VRVHLWSRLTNWKELLRWCSTTPVVALNETNHASKQWGSTAPQVVPKDADIQCGHVGVAGRTKRPQKSSWRRRWRIGTGTYTAIAGSPQFTPFSVMWREMYRQLPNEPNEDPHRHPDADPPLTLGQLRFMLDKAMSCFDARPDREQLARALNEVAEEHGEKFPEFGYLVFGAFEALDRMDGHLTGWRDGLIFSHRRGVGGAQIASESTDAVREPQT
jgi:hypothetical protein